MDTVPDALSGDVVELAKAQRAAERARGAGLVGEDLAEFERRVLMERTDEIKDEARRAHRRESADLQASFADGYNAAIEDLRWLAVMSRDVVA